MLYVSSSCIEREKISETVHEYAECGIKNIELSGGTKYYSGWEEDLLILKNKYHLNYVFHAYFPPPEYDFVINLAAYPDGLGKKSLQFYLDNIPVMRRLGCGVLSIHAGFFVEVSAAAIGKDIGMDRIYDRALAEKHFIENYLYLEQETRRKGIKLLLENNVLSKRNYENFNRENYFMLTDFQEYDCLNQKMPFKLLLDLGHLNVSCHTLGLDYEWQAEQLMKKAEWIHISDNSGTVDEHRIVDENSVILKQLLRNQVSDIPITMETKGSLHEVVKNYEMLREKIK